MSATLSGPVVIPKLYNGRNRTFFLIGFQRQQAKESATTWLMFPARHVGRRLQLRRNRRSDLRSGYTDAAAERHLSRTQFRRQRDPGEPVRPRGRKISCASTVERGARPLDQTFTDRTGPHNNFSFDSALAVLPHRPRLQDRPLVLRPSQDLRPLLQPPPPRLTLRLLQGSYANTLFDYNCTACRTTRTVVVSDTITISPTTINEIRVGVNRRKITRVPESLDQNWAGQLGIPNVGRDTLPSFSELGRRHPVCAAFPKAATSM